MDGLVDPIPTVLRARWILTAESPPIHDGRLVVHCGRIVDVGPTPPAEISEMRENVAIVPEFINAHTHLEFSSLRQPLGTPGMSFPDWIRRVIAWRRSRDADSTEGLAEQHKAIQAGIDEIRRGAASAVGEIATSEIASEELATAGMPGIAFLELIGLAPTRIEPLVGQARDFLAATHAGTGGAGRGISPHAPYTVHPELLQRVVGLSSRHKVPLAMHLAETLDELQLLRDGSGPLRDLLEELNALEPGVFGRNSRPLDYLKNLAQAHHALVVHGNYADANERQFLADHRDRLTVIYCPRTHEYFGHSPYPLADLVSRGARVALGTDSRASNPDLDMLQETRFAAARHPQVAPEEILRMATLHGALALGLDGELGSLRAGKRARFLSLKLPPEGRNDPYSWLNC